MQAARDVGRYGISQVNVDGKPVVVLAVARRRDGFAQTSSGVVRVRRGTRDDPLFGAELVRFANERTSSRYETTPISASIDDIARSLRGEVGRALGLSRVTASRLEIAELAIDDRLTVAGALYLLSDPASVLGKTFVEVLRYPDDTTVDYDRREEMRGPIHHVLQQAVHWVTDELGVEMVVLWARRFELPRIPEVVLREALANALAHRSYEAAGTAVRVELRPSAVVVRSPRRASRAGHRGEHPRDERSAKPRSHPHPPRTRARRGRGSGHRRHQDTMAAEMLDPPRFTDHGHEVVVELPIRSAVAPPSAPGSTTRAPRHAARQRSDRTRPRRPRRNPHDKRVRELTGVDTHAARDVLHRLRDEGFLEQHGQRGGADYRLSGTLQAPAGLRLSPDELADVVARLAATGPVTNSGVRAATGLDRAEALAILDRLVTDGRLIRTGQRRGTRYQHP